MSLERLLKTHLADQGLSRLAPRLKGYLSEVVTPTVERQKREGAVDFSAIAFLIYPCELSDVIRSWLEISPDKVLFGTDGFEIDPDMLILNWEELTWIGTSSARQAVALALTAMMHDREITHEEAVGIARKVLRENAVKLYKLQTP